jgi:hypothetical protein
LNEKLKRTQLILDKTLPKIIVLEQELSIVTKEKKQPNKYNRKKEF